MTETSENDVEVHLFDAPSTMFGAPRWIPDDSYDIVFVGIPSDAGGLGNRSPAAAPSFLRTASSLFPISRSDSGECRGWFDYTSQRVLLKGARMADAGDIKCDRGAGIGALESLPALYTTLRESCGQLVILGGDHSISYFLAKSMSGEGLVWIDAHEDAGAKSGRYPHCANVVTYIDELPNVPVIAQYGLRGIVSANRIEPPNHRHLCATPGIVVEALDQHDASAAAITIDVDVFDPSVLPAVGSTMPEGLQPAAVLDLFTALRQAGISIPVLEIAEFAPSSEHDITSGLLLVNFLLRALERSRIKGAT